MIILNYTAKKLMFLISLMVIFSFLLSCGIYKPVDARKVSPNSKERVKKNLEEGKGMSIGKMMKGSGGTNYQFASSNPMWRATLEILDFLPLANVDYSGGIITTDWYNEGTSTDESIKITIRFLSNEISVGSLDVKIFKKICDSLNSCRTEYGIRRIKLHLICRVKRLQMGIQESGIFALPVAQKNGRIRCERPAWSVRWRKRAEFVFRPRGAPVRPGAGGTVGWWPTLTLTLTPPATTTGRTSVGVWRQWQCSCTVKHSRSHTTQVPTRMSNR